MRISDWSSDVCSSDLLPAATIPARLVSKRNQWSHSMIGDFEQQRVKLSTGVELDVVDMGPKDAPAQIFLHGFPESHRTWRHQLPHFPHRFRCIRPHQRAYPRLHKTPRASRGGREVNYG